MTSQSCPSTQPPTAAERRRNARMKAQLRAVIALALFIFWGISALTGFLLYVAPTGPRSGRLVLFFLTKQEWGDVHFWFSVAAGIITLIHIAVDWKALRACVRFLVSTERGQMPRM